MNNSDGEGILHNSPEYFIERLVSCFKVSEAFLLTRRCFSFVNISLYERRTDVFTRRIPPTMGFHPRGKTPLKHSLWTPNTHTHICTQSCTHCKEDACVCTRRRMKGNMLFTLFSTDVDFLNKMRAVFFFLSFFPCFLIFYILNLHISGVE